METLKVIGTLVVFFGSFYIGFIVIMHVSCIVKDWIYYGLAITIGSDRKIYRSVHDIITGSKDSDKALQKILLSSSMKTAYQFFIANVDSKESKIAIALMLTYFDLTRLGMYELDEILKKLENKNWNSEAKELYERAARAKEAKLTLIREKR